MLLFFFLERVGELRHYIKKKKRGIFPPKSYIWEGAVTPLKYIYPDLSFEEKILDQSFEEKILDQDWTKI